MERRGKGPGGHNQCLGTGQTSYSSVGCWLPESKSKVASAFDASLILDMQAEGSRSWQSRSSKRVWLRTYWLGPVSW